MWQTCLANHACIALQLRARGGGIARCKKRLLKDGRALLHRTRLAAHRETVTAPCTGLLVGLRVHSPLRPENQKKR